MSDTWMFLGMLVIGVLLGVIVTLAAGLMMSTRAGVSED